MLVEIADATTDVIASCSPLCYYILLSTNGQLYCTPMRYVNAMCATIDSIWDHPDVARTTGALAREHVTSLMQLDDGAGSLRVSVPFMLHMERAARRARL